MFEMETADPDSAILRLLTVTPEPDGGALFSGEALFHHVLSSNLTLVQALMDSGVDLTATIQDNETALHLVSREGHAQIVEALLVG